MGEMGRETGGSLHFRRFDLGNIPEIPDFVKAIRKEFGAIYGNYDSLDKQAPLVLSFLS
jgi:hypothetical protein